MEISSVALFVFLEDAVGFLSVGFFTDFLNAKIAVFGAFIPFAMSSRGMNNTL